MERIKKMLIAGIILILIGAILMFPYEKPQTGEIHAEKLSTDGINSINPVILDFNGSYRAFWIGSIKENGTDRYYIFHSALNGKVWSVGNIISSGEIHPISLSGASYGTLGIIAFTERGGAGSIYFMKTTDSGKTWSAPSFLLTGEYPEFWVDEGIYMVSYNSFNRTHTVVSFNSTENRQFTVGGGDFLPPKVTPIRFSNRTFLFFIRNGSVCYSSFEKGFYADNYETILSWSNISEINPVVSKGMLYLFFSTFEGDKLRIWEVHSDDTELWSNPALIGDSKKGTAFSASSDGDIYVAWNMGNFTVIKSIGDGKEVKILPSGDGYFLCDNVLVFSSGDVGAMAIYAHIVS